MTITVRGHTITASTTLVVEECCNCHVLFALTTEHRDELMRTHEWFYCPSGHRQHYTGKSEEQKLREKNAELQRRVELRDERIARVVEDRDRLDRSARALRGHLTRMRNRVANGVCPVPGCKRSGFAQVMRHVATVHPAWHAEHAHEIEEA